MANPVNPYEMFNKAKLTIHDLFETLDNYEQFFISLSNNINKLEIKVKQLEGIINDKDLELDSLKDEHIELISKSDNFFAENIELIAENTKLKSIISDLETKNKESHDALRMFNFIQSMVDSEVTKKINNTIFNAPVSNNQWTYKEQGYKEKEIPKEQNNSIPNIISAEDKEYVIDKEGTKWEIDKDIPKEDIRVTEDGKPYDIKKEDQSKKYGHYTLGRKLCSTDDLQGIKDIPKAAGNLLDNIITTVTDKQPAKIIEEQYLNNAYHNFIFTYKILYDNGYKLYKTKGCRYKFFLPQEAPQDVSLLTIVNNEVVGSRKDKGKAVTSNNGLFSMPHIKLYDKGNGILEKI